MFKLNSNLVVCDFCEGYSKVKVENTLNGKVTHITIERCPKKCRNGFYI